MSVRLAVLLLAAGESSRYGDNKLLSEHPKGDSLLEYVIKQYEPFSDLPVTIVTGAYEDEIKTVLSHRSNVHIIHNPQWQDGMGGSIAAGIDAIEQHHASLKVSQQPTHILIGLCDTPCVTTGSLSALVEKVGIFEQSRIASEASGKRMAPAIFPVSDIDVLKGLKGDRGAAKLLKGAVPDCFAIPHPEAIIDIDKPDDWLNLPR